MKSVIAAVAVLAVFSSSGVAYAQTKMRPGLWEHSFTMKSQGGQTEKSMSEMQQQMASMPPEQRKMMEQMMAKQGMSMGAGGKSVQICITKEQAERDELPQQEGRCSQQIVQRTANAMKVKFSCTGNPPTTGESEINFVSPTAYTGRTVVNTTAHGKPERMNMDQSGKWLSADCGSVKPMQR